MIILITPLSRANKLASNDDIPDCIDAKIRIMPATKVNILMNPAGVGFAQLDQILSTSNALIRNAPPSTLINTAKISFVYPTTEAIPPINNKIPGTPRTNFEYFES